MARARRWLPRAHFVVGERYVIEQGKWRRAMLCGRMMGMDGGWRHDGELCERCRVLIEERMALAGIRFRPRPAPTDVDIERTAPVMRTDKLAALVAPTPWRRGEGNRILDANGDLVLRIAAIPHEPIAELIVRLVNSAHGDHRAAVVHELREQGRWMREKVEHRPVGDMWSPGILAAARSLEQDAITLERGEELER